ncbi:hypothetical protein BD410DRAFT_785474 [Rickenella mellea]|uniref:Uncharacterized protein n=1 Tax=Rickenella mellea TaxID=50990 RepID=A0A4Y7QD41_9AGAM|nr:hypothetical protein BD410DRAFT_785474 [Rickenella mellea]
MLLSPASSSGGLPSAGFWSKITKKGKDNDRQMQMHQMHNQLARQRFLTLVHGEMETVRMLPPTYGELDALARDWVKPPPEANFSLRIPVEFASFQAARFISGPFIWIDSDDSYQIAIAGVQGSRVEICSDAPPPPDEPASPPPPPVLEMEGIFNLELNKGQHVAIDVTISSDELDMSRTEDGTTVAGIFLGRLDIVNDGDTHRMEFSGARLQGEQKTPDFNDSLVVSKLAVAAKPTTAKCTLSILAPEQQYCEVNVTVSPYWTIGMTWPPAENLIDNKFKYFLRTHPGGALEHFDTESVVTSLYYEAIPDPGSVDPQTYISSRNSFAMSLREFIPHISKVLENLGLTLQARTNFINNNIAAFSAHKNIAYRFMAPGRLAAAIDISVTADPCIWTRIFLMFRGISDEEMGDFIDSGEKEANHYNWRELVGWTEASKDSAHFRVLETSIFELS